MARPKNFRKIPDWIATKVAKIRPKPAVVGCVKKIPVAEITREAYAHLGIGLSGGKPTFQESLVPNPEIGKYSDWNANGYEIVRRDLPKVPKTFTIETPNWGDWSRGSHDVHPERQVYQREFVPPRENEITFELVGKEAGGEEVYVFRFVVSEVMDTSKRSFEQILLFNLNLLLENVGAADVFHSDATVKDYLKSIYVNWEILPPGERDQNIARILKAVGDTPEAREKIKDRYEFFEKLNPQAFIQGHGGFRRYFGAKFSDNLVVFENMQYGNAIYAMFTDWTEQSKRTKQELLAGGRAGKDFERIPHVKAWKKSVKTLIKARLKNEGS